jgi:hypothetical protein
MGENSEKIWTIQKKVSWRVKRFKKYGRNPSWIVIRFGKYCRKYWTDLENTEENSEKIGKIQTKIVNRYGKYGTKVSWIVKRFGKYRRK